MIKYNKMNERGAFQSSRSGILKMKQQHAVCSQPIHLKQRRSLAAACRCAFWHERGTMCSWWVPGRLPANTCCGDEVFVFHRLDSVYDRADDRCFRFALHALNQRESTSVHQNLSVKADDLTPCWWFVGTLLYCV